MSKFKDNFFEEQFQTEINFLLTKDQKIYKSIKKIYKIKKIREKYKYKTFHKQKL